MIDNYDSYTYNLVQYLGELGADVETVRSRNKIVTPGGLRWLTIPVSVEGKYHQTMRVRFFLHT